MAGRPVFYLLDGHGLAYRHYFAMITRPFMTSSGEITSAVFGFTRTLMDILEKDRPYYLAVAFDEGLSGRDELYDQYKGTREKMPDELASQIGRIKQMVETFNIPILSLPGYEADDLMGTAAKQADANRARFGRSKSDRAQEQRQRERAEALLDQHRLDDGEAS